MAKVALLIGIGEYGSGLNPLPDAVKDVEAVQQVLQSLKMGRFDQVKQLSNPNPPVMREAFETLFSGRTQDDLVLLFFSGHIVWDDSGKLYLATAITPKSPRAELIRVSAIPVSFVHDLISQSPCQHHIVILDCCLNLVSAPEIATLEEQTLELKSLLGDQRQSILACFTPIQDSLEPRDYPHSIYTRYLVEGIKTGAADLNHEGWISVRELHEYATQRTQIAAPLLKPEFYSTDGGDQIVLFKAPLDDPNLKYRRAVSSWVSEGKISPMGRSSLDKLAESLGITSQECSAIEAEVLKPDSEYQEKLQQYKRELAKVISYDYPLATPERKQLRIVQQCLGLREQDVAPIEEQMSLRLASLHEAEDEEVDQLTPVHSNNQPTVASSGQRTVLQHSTRLLPEEPTPPTPESEDEADKLTPTHSDSQSVIASSGQRTVLQHSTRLLPEEPTPPTPESEDEADKLTPTHSDSQPTVASSGQRTVLQHSTRLLSEEPTPPTLESEDEADKLTPVHHDSQPTVASSGQRTVLQHSTRLLSEEPTPPTPEFEDEADKLTPTHSDSQPTVASSGQRTVLQHSTRLLPEEPTPPTPESEDEADKLTPTHSDSQSTVASSGQRTVLQHSTRLLPEEPTPPTLESEDEADKLTPAHSDSQPTVVPATQKTVLQESTRLLPVQPAPPTPSGNLSSNSAESTTHSPSASASAFPYKFLLPVGIGGALVAVALAIGISRRNSVTPPANPGDRASSLAGSSSQSSPTVKNLNQETSPTPSTSPKSQDCMIFVNGNLRSEPVSLESEVLESFKGALSVTGKRTDKGWIQVKLSSGKLAWAHPGIISSASEREMETCLTLKRNSN